MRLPFLCSVHRLEQVLTAMRGFIHIAVGILLGILYWQTGDQAAIVFSNAGFLYFTQFFILFTSMMPTVLTCQYNF